MQENLQNNVPKKNDVQENLQNDVQEHCADAQEQKKFSQIGKSCETGFLKISLGKTFSSKYPWEKYFPQNIFGKNIFQENGKYPFSLFPNRTGRFGSTSLDFE